MLTNGNLKRTDTTFGELIVALSDAAFEICSDKKEAYALVATALKDLLGPRSLKINGRIRKFRQSPLASAI